MFNIENIFKFKISGLEGLENDLLTRAGSDRGYFTSEVIHTEVKKYTYSEKDQKN